MTLKRAGVLFSLLLAAGGASTGCVAPAAAPPLSSTFNGTDIAWIQLMIPMNEQLIPLLQQASSRAADPSLRRLADEILLTHADELVRLRQLRALAGVPVTNIHAGHDMPGLVTDADLAVIAQATAVDQLVVGCLGEHLRQTAQLARSEQLAGVDPATTAFAADLHQRRAAQLVALQAIGSASSCVNGP